MLLNALVPFAVAACLAAWCCSLRADPRVGAEAFVAPPPCSVDPFADGSVSQYLEELRSACGADVTQLALRGADSDAGPGLLRAEAQQRRSVRFGALTTTFRLAWAGAGESDGRLHTEQALVAAGGLLHIDRALALQAQLGPALAGDVRQRARFTSLWRPRENSLLFAE